MIVPIVFSSNDYYAPMLGVTLHSLIKYANPEITYYIFVLSEFISEAHWNRLKAMETDHIHLEQINVIQYMMGKDIVPSGHISRETTFRLLVDQLFPQYEKVLYLDADILVRSDVSRLYETDISDYVFGASRGKLFKLTRQYVENFLNIPVDDYFNAGVLLINLKRYREEEIGKKAFHLLDGKRFLSAEQDVLNILCRGKVHLIDGRWNVEWQHVTPDGIGLVTDGPRSDMLSYDRDPYISHYTSKYKPWNHPELSGAEIYWREARETDFYEELLQICAISRVRELSKEKERLFSAKAFRFPAHHFRQGEEIVIYGAGMVGDSFVRQLRYTGFCRVVCVCDKNRNVPYLPACVISPEELAKMPSYRILIAIENRDTASAIMRELVGLGIAEDRLIWDRYLPDAETAKDAKEI